MTLRRGLVHSPKIPLHRRDSCRYFQSLLPFIFLPQYSHQEMSPAGHDMTLYCVFFGVLLPEKVMNVCGRRH